ncbi:MAG TPA: hypothetical protein PKC70_13290, partial [Cellvibrionaceae bacterium]|nr:hypothetical protein [Cellvibrionaceae bacterium]
CAKTRKSTYFRQFLRCEGQIDQDDLFDRRVNRCTEAIAGVHIALAGSYFYRLVISNQLLLSFSVYHVDCFDRLTPPLHLRCGGTAYCARHDLCAWQNGDGYFPGNKNSRGGAIVGVQRPHR